MLNQTHPDDERLAALAGGDPEASSDAAVTAHVASCDRCAEVVRDLEVLRAAIADLPDVTPSRPLQLVPGVEASRDEAGGWVRRAFGPVMAVGAGLALVGLIGTTAPALSGMATAPVGDQLVGVSAAASAGELPAFQPASSEADGGVVGGEALDGSKSPQRDAAVEHGQEGLAGSDPSAEPATYGATNDVTSTPGSAERSLWPMVLFSGIALMVGIALLRWVLAPRAG